MQRTETAISKVRSQPETYLQQQFSSMLIGLTQLPVKNAFVGLFLERCKKHCRGGIHASRWRNVPFFRTVRRKRTVYYYLIDDNSVIPDTGEFTSHKDNCNVVLGWMPIEEIQNVIIYPEFLKNEISHLDEPVKHFVSKG